MEKMTAERAVKLLAEHGTNLSLAEATIVVDFLRKLAKMAVTQYLRTEADLPQENEDDFTRKTA